VKINDYRCFKQVASVLGDLQAVQELNCVLQSGIEVDPDEDLVLSFSWVNTPQGKDYWKSIYEKSIDRKFGLESKEKVTQDPYVEILTNYAQVIAQCGGSIETFIGQMDTMTVKEMLVKLAPNGVRFIYDK